MEPLTKEQKEFLDRIAYANWEYRYGLVDINSSVNLFDFGLETFPVNFGVIKGSFLCHKNKLINLKGSPRRITGNFIISNNKLKNLEGGPLTVNKRYYCNNNPLTSLKGFPKKTDSVECNLSYNMLIDNIKHINDIEEITYDNGVLNKNDINELKILGKLKIIEELL